MSRMHGSATEEKRNWNLTNILYIMCEWVEVSPLGTGQMHVFQSYWGCDLSYGNRWCVLCIFIGGAVYLFVRAIRVWRYTSFALQYGRSFRRLTAQKHFAILIFRRRWWTTGGRISSGRCQTNGCVQMTESINRQFGAHWMQWSLNIV